MSESPTEPGGFVGDIYYGDPERTTFGTHRWNGTEWMKLASEAEALTMLLGSARARIADLERQLAGARTDAEQAVALAYQRAADQVRCGCNAITGCMDMANCAQEDVDAILALAPAEPLAEVERMRQQIEAVCRAHMVSAERPVALEDENERLRQALEWYDDGSSMGTRARAALKGGTP